MDERRIEDYALIGDCSTAALVRNDGSLDWLCLPRFDSPASFAALVGDDRHGRFRVAPCAPARRTSRRYRDSTLVLETRFETEEGVVTLTDFMPVRDETADVVRIVRGERGAVPMRLEFSPRFDYGSTAAWLERTDGGVLAIGGPDALRLVSPLPLELSDDDVSSSFTIRENEELTMHLAWAPSHVPMSTVPDAHDALDRTLHFWRGWASRCRFRGPYRDAVVRSFVTLKALTYAPTGAIVAAPTTSLPERLGGVRNWDYRYCWLRDATFTLIALLQAGYDEEAGAFRSWLMRATAGKPSQIHLMYGIHGERRLDERTLPWLPGFGDSAPVRIGNAAYGQFQLDVFGEVMDALLQCWKVGLDPGAAGSRLEQVMMNYLERAWERADEGIWEVRGPRRQFTHSKVMAWVGVDRAIRAAEAGWIVGPVDRWRALRANIHAQVCEYGFDRDRGAFVQHYGSKHLDASLLMIPLVGFLPVGDPRVRATIAAIERELAVGPFVARYQTDPAVDGLPPGEASFILCSFWMIDCLVLLGRVEEARARFERMLAIRNDVGLLSECYDVESRALAGNFPQAFSHIGLVSSARSFEASPVSIAAVRAP